MSQYSPIKIYNPKRSCCLTVGLLPCSDNHFSKRVSHMHCQQRPSSSTWATHTTHFTESNLIRRIVLLLHALIWPILAWCVCPRFAFRRFLSLSSSGCRSRMHSPLHKTVLSRHCESHRFVDSVAHRRTIRPSLVARICFCAAGSATTGLLCRLTALVARICHCCRPYRLLPT